MMGLPGFPSSMIVSALYTNIPHEEGTDACPIALEQGRDPGTKPSPLLYLYINTTHPYAQLLHFSWQYILTNSRHRYGYMYGPYVRQHLHGGHREETSGFFPRQTTCLAKIHRWHLPHLDPWPCQTRSIHPTCQYISPHHQIHQQHFAHPRSIPWRHGHSTRQLYPHRSLL